MKSPLTLLFLFCCNVLSAQIADTIYRDGKVIVRTNIIVTYDSATWLRQQTPVTNNNLRKIKQQPSIRRQANPCGVTASFTPDRDTTFPVYFNATFNSTSKNATALQWILNGFPMSNADSLQMNFGYVGLYEIMLVANNGACSDTSRVYYFHTGVDSSNRPLSLINYGLPDTEEYSTSIEHLRSGGYLLGGYSTYWPDQGRDRGLLIKIKESGCVEWTKLFQNEHFGRVGSITALKDSGFVISYSGYQITTLMRFDKNGQTMWKKSFTESSFTVPFAKIFEAADGSLFTVGPSVIDGFYVAKLTSAGTILWSKHYMKDHFDMIGPQGIAEIGKRIFISGYLSNPNQETPYNSEYNKDGFIISLNQSDGKTVWSKTYGAVGFSNFFQQLYAYGNNLLVNDIQGSYLSDSDIRQGYHFIDTFGNVLKSRIVLPVEPLRFPFTSNVIPLSNNKLYLTQGGYEPMDLQPGYTYMSYWQKIDTSDVIEWQLKSGSVARNRFWYSVNGKNETLYSLGEQSNQLLKTYQPSHNFLLAKLDSSGPDISASCLFYPAENKIIPNEIVSYPIEWTRDINVALQTSNGVTDPDAYYSQSRYQCPDFINGCAYIMVNGVLDVCDLSQTYTYHASKTKGCGGLTSWQVPDNVQILSKTDTDLTVRFTSFGQYTIKALLNNTCDPVIDSVVVTAASSSAVLNLGTDTSLCTGNNLILHAGSDFLNYKWHNGSTDSLYTVTQPGKYWISVTDSCGNILSDTITVLRASAVPISIGPDRVKCNSDTIRLSAPPGFISYTWSNQYNISSTTSQNVVVNPLIDTSYFIKAEKTQGCFAYDTVHIKVNYSPAINIGSDKSFCLGDSVVFDAGGAFQSYLWSSGETSNQITVKTAGVRSVIGTTLEGCKSYDTAKVTSVFPLPVVNLDKQTSLCIGTGKTLDAGNFSAYVWNTGATTSTITVNSIGMYAVTVTDANGCRSKDSTAITTLHPAPAGFLPGDTAICSYGNLVLQTTTSFSGYLWSTGSVSSAISITQPGIYWLRVKDNNSCEGIDSVIVAIKNCMKGFYVPSAFTPNDDGKNDVFRPLLFGTVLKYRFTVYNRWGEPVYQTSEVQRGWDGKLAGKPQSGVFVWHCTYQFEGEVSKTEKGTVTIIR